MSAEPISYPGNPALPREVRDKILSTFRHTLNLYKEGKADDCVIGCDFILKMDPRFAPARQLMEKAKNPAAGVDVGALESIVAATPTRQERMASVDTDRLLVRAAESLNARDFDAAMAAAEQVLQVLPGNQDAGAILEQARQRKNAQPQFEVARQRAIAALDGQRPADARAALDKMRLLDPEHPAVALLERRISAAAAPAASEVGESTNPGLSLGEIPDMAPPDATPLEPAPDGLDHLSLDSLSLDEPSPAYVPPPRNLTETTGPLSLGNDSPADYFGSAPEPGSPPNLWNESSSEESSGSGYGLSGFEEPASAPSPEPHFSVSAPAAAPEPSPQHEVESLLARGDDAARTGNRQQAIEIWSRIFLIDINNSEAVGRIEAARKEMAEGNRRVAESLRRGREKFEAGDFTAAREAFLEVLALDESDATARSFLDRIEQELARPSAGLDLSRKTPTSDILAEEMAEAAEPLAPEEPVAAAAKAPAAPKAARRPMDRRFLMALGGALVLALAVGGFFMLRSGGTKAAPAPSGEGPSLEHATALFREGKLAETVAELRQISPGHPDYARAQKLLASLTRKSGEQAPATASGGEAAPGEAASSAPASTGPPPESVRHREEAEKALNDKRYIDALKSFNLAAPAYSQDPSFATLMASASEKVSELTPAVKLYNEGEYETAIPILWRIFQSDRANQDARSYLLRSYYNQGIAQLQNGLYAKAAESFGEVIAVDPNDTASVRHKKFAERYGKGDLDLMGRIYVRHIQQRP
jgi:tetratricopeptide (TPR) repeat protein